MNLKPMGWMRVLRGLREGNQAVLLTGLALVALQRVRSSRGKRELIYRKELPVGSAVVIRHQRPDDPRVGIRTRD